MGERANKEKTTKTGGPNKERREEHIIKEKGIVCMNRVDSSLGPLL